MCWVCCLCYFMIHDFSGLCSCNDTTWRWGSNPFGRSPYQWWLQSINFFHILPGLRMSQQQNTSSLPKVICPKRQICQIQKSCKSLGIHIPWTNARVVALYQAHPKSKDKSFSVLSLFASLRVVGDRMPSSPRHWTSGSLFIVSSPPNLDTFGMG